MGPEEVTVTDITINSLTVTFREAFVARGFFRSWELEIWHYRDWVCCERGGKENRYILFFFLFCFDYALAHFPPLFQTTFICTISSNQVKTFQNVVSGLWLQSITVTMIKFVTILIVLWSCIGHETNQASFSDTDFAMFCSLQIQVAEMSLIWSGHVLA